MIAPLHEVRVVELEGLGPGPLAGWILADMGAGITVDVRPEVGAVSERLGDSSGIDVLRRGKRALTSDLKSADGLAHALDLIAESDALIGGNRAGVMELPGP